MLKKQPSGELTLHVDCSALKGQTCLVKAVNERNIQLLENVYCERIENIIGKLIIELRRLVFSYNVTTVATDGTRKTVRTFRYRGAIEEFTTAFWARELNFVHK
nr:hypothetical protein [Enterobacter kobei]